MNQSIINIAKGEEVLPSTLDFFLMNTCTLVCSCIDGQMECRWSLCLYMHTVYVSAHWCIPQSLFSCSLTALFKYMGPGFQTSPNLYKKVQNLVVKITVNGVTITLVPGKPRINSPAFF